MWKPIFTSYQKISWLTDMPKSEIMTFDPEEPHNVVPREELRRLYRLAIDREEYWARQTWIAPALPPPDQGMPMG